MARERRRTTKEAPRGRRKKICFFCAEKVEWIDYKDVNLLRRYISDRAKIRTRRVSGNCAQHQREVAVAIKTARELALLPYTQRTMSERSGSFRTGRRDSSESQPPRGEAPEVDEIDEETDEGEEEEAS